MAAQTSRRHARTGRRLPVMSRILRPRAQAGHLPAVPVGLPRVVRVGPLLVALADRLPVRLARGLRAALADLPLLVAPVAPPGLAAAGKAPRRRRC